jgi:hypothetical protein
LILFKSLAFQKTKALLAVEEDDGDISQNPHDSEDDNPQPSKRICSRNRSSMDDEEMAYAGQFQDSSTINADLDRISEEEEEPGYGDINQQDEEDNLMVMDKNSDTETNVFGGGETNGVCRLFSITFFLFNFIFIVIHD